MNPRTSVSPCFSFPKYPFAADVKGFLDAGKPAATPIL